MKRLIGQTTGVVGDERLRSFTMTIRKELDYYRFNHATPPEKSYALDRLYDRAAKRCLISNDLEQTTLEQFVLTNQTAGGIEVKLSNEIISDARDFITHALEKFTYYQTGNVQEDFNLTLLLSLWRFGPGSSRGTRATHFVDKIDLESGTVTKRALPYAILLRKVDPCLHSIDGDEVYRFRKVEGSSIGCVPKNEEVHRTIGTEPLYNMALQLAAGAYLDGALRSIGLDIHEQQEVNNLLASIGSETQELATLDLKSASDLLSIALIKALWPSSWFDFMMAVRSPSAKVKLFGWVELNMMSTMGNGFTFPMMTLTLLALVYAVQSKRIGKRYFVDFDNTGVYGDDIIIPVEDYDALVEVLEQAGLVVNKDKSYRSGAFRESCGGDYYAGVDVTPFYVTSLLNDAEVYVAINQLLKWVGTQKVPLPETLELLVSFLHRPSTPFLVPEWCDATAGIRTSQVTSRYKLLSMVENTRLVSKKYDTRLLSYVILGGYVTSCGGSDRVRYTPRRLTSKDDEPVEAYYTIEEARLPKGRLDGRDPVVRDPVSRIYIDTFLEVVLADLRAHREVVP